MDVGYHNSEFRSQDEPDRSPIEATVDRAQWVEGEGLSLFSVMDHVWQLPFNGRRDDPFLECYTALTAIARETSSMELSALVTCPHYRNPAYFGRVLASLDHVSGGRAVLGIGAGWYEDEYDAMGIPFPDISTRNRQMRETIELCRAMWSESSPVSYEGNHFDLNEFYCEPKPEEVPVPVGGGGEQLTLRRLPSTPTAGTSPPGIPRSTQPSSTPSPSTVRTSSETSRPSRRRSGTRRSSERRPRPPTRPTRN